MLRRNNEEAVGRGAFGAPTLFVGTEMFWGNDRLDLVEAALRGREYVRGASALLPQRTVKSYFTPVRSSDTCHSLRAVSGSCERRLELTRTGCPICSAIPSGP